MAAGLAAELAAAAMFTIVLFSPPLPPDSVAPLPVALSVAMHAWVLPKMLISRAGPYFVYPYLHYYCMASYGTFVPNEIYWIRSVPGICTLPTMYTYITMDEST